MTRYPYLVVLHDGSSAWLLSEISSVEKIEARIKAGTAAKSTGKNRPVAANEDTTEIVLNWNYIVGITACPAVEA